MHSNEVSLIIPTKNEEQNIIAFLQSIPADCRLIVVDSGNDNTEAIIRQHRPEQSLVIKEDCNIPQARQLGAKRAKTPWLLYSDADMRLAPDYFEQLKGFQPQSDTGAIMGAKLSDQKYRRYYRFYSLGIKFWARLGVPLGSGSNMLIRKQALEHVGGFDEQLTHSEDNDILIRIKKAGWRVVYNGGLRVFENDHRRLERGVSRKFFHGTIRAFALYTGIGKKYVRASDWGYWDKPSLRDK